MLCVCHAFFFIIDTTTFQIIHTFFLSKGFFVDFLHSENEWQKIRKPPNSPAFSKLPGHSGNI